MSRTNLQYSNRYFATTAEAAAATQQSNNTANAATAAGCSSSNVIHTATIDFSRLDGILEEEKIASRKESWNKIENGLKIQKLHVFAEMYARENSLPAKDIKLLKVFFDECVQKNKLCKAKDVSYDKNTGVIMSVPALSFNAATRAFTLRNMDKSRVSTLKSLTPKRLFSEISAPTSDIALPPSVEQTHESC